MSHIALVIPGLDRIGGAERQAMLLAGGLVQRGWKVDVIALTGRGGAAASELRAAGAGFLSLEMRKGLADPRGWIRFNRWINRHAPEVVHAHLPHAAWLARWSRPLAPVRVLLDTLHTSSTGTWGRRMGYRGSNWLPDRVTAVSRAVADAHLAERMVSAAKLGVLPNGIDGTAWTQAADAGLQLRSELRLKDEFVWLAAGRLEAVKDYATLLQALALLGDRAHLLVAGAGALEGELCRLSQRLGIDQRVHWLGFQKDVGRWMRAADGFVLSSLWEGLPMALLEAGACGLPAVATDVAGVQEVIANEDTGYLAPAGNAIALAGSMGRVMALAPQERRAMGQRFRESVTERFSLDAVLDSWEALYRELLRKNPVAKRSA